MKQNTIQTDRFEWTSVNTVSSPDSVVCLSSKTQRLNRQEEYLLCIFFESHRMRSCHRWQCWRAEEKTSRNRSLNLSLSQMCAVAETRQESADEAKQKACVCWWKVCKVTLNMHFSRSAKIHATLYDGMWQVDLNDYFSFFQETKTPVDVGKTGRRLFHLICSLP